MGVAGTAFKAVNQEDYRYPKAKLFQREAKVMKMFGPGMLEECKRAGMLEEYDWDRMADDMGIPSEDVLFKDIGFTKIINVEKTFIGRVQHFMSGLLPR